MKSTFDTQKPLRTGTHKSLACPCGAHNVVPNKQRGKGRCHNCGGKNASEKRDSAAPNYVRARTILVPVKES